MSSIPEASSSQQHAEEPAFSNHFDISETITANWEEAATALADVATTILSSAEGRKKKYPDEVKRAAAQYLLSWQKETAQSQKDSTIGTRFRKILPAPPSQR